MGSQLQRLEGLEPRFKALVEGRLLRREDVEEAFMTVARAIWFDSVVPSSDGLDSVSLCRYGYLLETIKLFTRDRDLCRVLDRQISRARMMASGDATDQGFLPGGSPAGLADPSDDLADFWGLQSGIKVHRIPGFLEAHFAMSEPVSGGLGDAVGGR